MSRRARNLLMLTSSLLVASGLVMPGVAAAATATPCDPIADNLCIYWGQNFDGASAMWGGQAEDHLEWTYPNNGTGAGQRIGNNGGSFLNHRYDRSVTVYYNPGWNGRPPGPNLHISPREGKNCAGAGPLICNNNRSHFYN